MPFRAEVLSEDLELRSPCVVLLAPEEPEASQGRWARVAPSPDGLAAAAAVLEEVRRAGHEAQHSPVALEAPVWRLRSRRGARGVLGRGGRRHRRGAAQGALEAAGGEVGRLGCGRLG